MGNKSVKKADQPPVKSSSFLSLASLRSGFGLRDRPKPTPTPAETEGRAWSAAGDFDRELVLKELARYNSKPKQQQPVDHASVQAELRKLNLGKNALAYYGIGHSNETIANLLCSTCFSREQQIGLVTLLTDTCCKVSVDDLYLSCIEASSIRVSNILLDKLVERARPHFMLREQLASGLNRVYSAHSQPLLSRARQRSSNNILNVSLFKFKCAIQIHTNYLVSAVSAGQMRATFRENQSFVLKLLDAGCRLGNADLDDPSACPFLFLFLFVSTGHLSARERHRFARYVNRGLRRYLRQFRSFDLGALPRGWLPAAEATTHRELSEKLYYLVKKSPLSSTWSADTRARLSQLITCDTSRRFFQPLSLEHLSRAALKRHLDVSKDRDHEGYVPRNLRKLVDYEQEQIESLTFYLIQ